MWEMSPFRSESTDASCFIRYCHVSLPLSSDLSVCLVDSRFVGYNVGVETSDEGARGETDTTEKRLLLALGITATVQVPFGNVYCRSILSSLAVAVENHRIDR